MEYEIGAAVKTIDGFNIALVEKIIAKISKDSYYLKPVERVYIPKKKGGVRSLGIPSFRDKLVQEVLQMQLEAIYGAIFTDNLHGLNKIDRKLARIDDKIGNTTYERIYCGLYERDC